MKDREELNNLSRTELLIGKEKTIRLRDASIIIVGLGAVGSYACEALARAGVGKMRLVDFDEVQSTNMNRNLLALTSTVGQAKVAVAADRVRRINPQCLVETIRMFAAADTLDHILAGTHNILIDAIDSVGPKAALLETCWRRQLPVISSMGAALRTDPSRIKVADLFKTHHCPLATQTRTYLRRRGVGRGITCVFSDEPVTFVPQETDDAEAAREYQRGRPRRRLGSLPTITAIFGLTVAHHAISHIIGGFAADPKSTKNG